MQEEKNNNTSAKVQQEHTESIGAILINARNHAELTQADIAELIRLPVRTIHALEVDDYEGLPTESTYIRGYLYNYARVVGIDAKGLLKVYDDQFRTEPEVIPVVRARLRHSYDVTILWSTAVVFTILAGLLVNWWADAKQAPEQNVELASSSVVVSPGIENQEPAQDLEAHYNAGPIQEEEEEQENEPAEKKMLNAEIQQVMQEESLNPNLVVLNDGPDVLTVTYAEESWTEIEDADRNPLMQGLIEPGAVRSLSGSAPFYVFLGNAPGVVIEINGQYFDHSQFNKSNRTARFQVSSGSLN